MIRTIFLASAMTMAAPVLAQTATPPAQTTTANPAAPTTSATTGGDQATTGQAAPIQTAPATTAQAQPAPTTPADPAQPAVADATATPGAAQGDQVAQAVDTQFAQYDKNADGKLDKVEFSSWMVALKTASDPATKADSPATKKWVGAAFAQADKNKNSSLDKTEVTGFLAQGQS
jgi:hypothetical protein